jgi:cytochrome c
MDSFEWNKIIGAVLGTAILIFVIRLVAENVYEAEKPAKPGYVVEGVVEEGGGGAAAPVEEPVPDWGTVLASANAANGKSVSARCEQCHDISSAKQSKIGPPLWGVIGRARATVPGFSYSSAMMGDHEAWNFTSLFKYLKSPASMVPGTKMSFAGLRAAQDRIDLIAFLRTQSDSPVAIPPPAPAAPPAEAAAAGDKAAPAGDKTAEKPGAKAAAADKAAAKPESNAAPGKSGTP